MILEQPMYGKKLSEHISGGFESAIGKYHTALTQYF